MKEAKKTSTTTTTATFMIMIHTLNCMITTNSAFSYNLPRDSYNPLARLQSPTPIILSNFIKLSTYLLL
jgi:hypothetical protein